MILECFLFVVHVLDNDVSTLLASPEDHLPGSALSVFHKLLAYYQFSAWQDAQFDNVGQVC